jgi:hypothetical protein
MVPSTLSTSTRTYRLRSVRRMLRMADSSVGYFRYGCTTYPVLATNWPHVRSATVRCMTAEADDAPPTAPVAVATTVPAPAPAPAPLRLSSMSMSKMRGSSPSRWRMTSSPPITLSLPNVDSRYGATPNPDPNPTDGEPIGAYVPG